MKAILTAALVAAFALPALAEDKARKEPSEKQQAQQARMKECNARAGERKGEERQTWMSACLRGEMAADKGADKKSAQQERMKSCNKQAADKSLKGDERKSFMSACLKG